MVYNIRICADSPYLLGARYVAALEEFFLAVQSGNLQRINTATIAVEEFLEERFSIARAATGDTVPHEPGQYALLDKNKNNSVKQD